MPSTHDMPAEFRVTPLADGVRYVLLRPPAGMYRVGGVGMLGFGLMMLASCAGWMWTASAWCV